jgi:hypothetical protein
VFPTPVELFVSAPANGRVSSAGRVIKERTRSDGDVGVASPVVAKCINISPTLEVSLVLLKRAQQWLCCSYRYCFAADLSPSPCYLCRSSVLAPWAKAQSRPAQVSEAKRNDGIRILINAFIVRRVWNSFGQLGEREMPAGNLA